MIETLSKVVYGVSNFSDYDIHLFKEGSHLGLHEKLGAHPMTVEGVKGIYFSVWAPNAQRVFVFGNFNEWNKESHPLEVRWDGSGIWEGFVPGLEKGELYKYHIASKYGGESFDKGDPYAFYWELSPQTASIVWDLDYDWTDWEWMNNRQEGSFHSKPVSIYEVHLGSWKRDPDEPNKFLTYRELAHELCDYVKKLGFTHIEFMPVMEHPFYGSWGYQVVGYFAPTSRYGTPQDFMYLIDYLHQNNIGVILDWVPAHFPADPHGLANFDGTHLYEHADPRRSFHPDWKSNIFNYGRNEVRNFLISNAMFWLEKYHVDGLRVDAIASMLYLNYSRKEGEWIPNRYGGKENLEAIDFIKKLNSSMSKRFPDVMSIAEESSSWPMVSRPVHIGGLGFGMKWDMGWMHDTLNYFSTEPGLRRYHHNEITNTIGYAFQENNLLALSHDEVVYGKKSLLSKMPGDVWQKFANLRLLFGSMFTYPGKKLIFMGGEFGPWKEWDHELSLDWNLLVYKSHRMMQDWISDLNALLKTEPALHELDFEKEGFEWIDSKDWEGSVISYVRKAKSNKDILLAVCNFTPAVRYDYEIGVPEGGFWQEVLNSDAEIYAGSGVGNYGGVEASDTPMHGRDHSLRLTLPPLAIVILKKTVTE
jgi:1,4-alpha-glucan branching enzyme